MEANAPLKAYIVVEQSLIRALMARREQWREILSDAASHVQQLIERAVACSCEGTLVVLMELVRRLANLLTQTMAREIVIKPILTLQAALGRCIADSSHALPTLARGDPIPVAGRLALMLASLASFPSGRAVVLSCNADVLAPAVVTALRCGNEASDAQRAGLLLLRCLCSPSRCPLVTTDDKPFCDLPELPVLGLAAIADDSSSDCAMQAKQLLAELHSMLGASAEPSMRKLGHVLGSADPVAALHAMAGDFSSYTPDAKHSHQEVCNLTLHVCPELHQNPDACALQEFQELMKSSKLFRSGLVRTDFQCNSLGINHAAARKRPRSDVGLEDRGDAPPPVRGVRVRNREEAPMLRGKTNPSRVVSKQGDGKRVQNSSRAPSKHVDDYQAAPMVRKTAPVDSSKGGFDGVDVPPAKGPDSSCAQPHSMVNRHKDSKSGLNGSRASGQGAVVGMNMQMLQQKLGLVAAQGTITRPRNTTFHCAHDSQRTRMARS